MSLKMKMLRESKKITKTELARLLEVTFRTITNWEKADGVVPSLQTMKCIAKAIGATTYDVFCCFVINPDEVPGNEGFKFNDHTSDIAEQYMTQSRPLQLFKYIKEFHLQGTGLVIYKYKIFRYNSLRIHEISPNDDIISRVLNKLPSSNDSIDDDRLNRLILQTMLPSDGVIAIDENGNTSLFLNFLEIRGIISLQINIGHRRTVRRSVGDRKALLCRPPVG